MTAKFEILSEIRRIAQANGGVPPGVRMFERETGIRQNEWLGVYWRAWGEAVQEAGFSPNKLNAKRLEDTDLLRRYCSLARELGRFPAKADLRLKRRSDASFPSDDSIRRRFGGYPAARAQALQFAETNREFADVVPFLVESPSRLNGAENKTGGVRPKSVGFVYLVKHGSRTEYKIGKTMNRLRREGEIRLQLPEKLIPVHYIETDDPAGIEAYWHARFASKRKEGEWFGLNRDDVAAFRRWKRIV